MSSLYGVRAWKEWVQSLGASQHRRGEIEVRADPLSCTSIELSYGLCRFLREARRPNGRAYQPDSLYYLCLSLQHYLFEHKRIDNIFTDVYYSRFSEELSLLLQNWRPRLLPSGELHSRVEEEHLWQCKQLGAFSPAVLLSTLLFFNAKFFRLHSLEEHLALSFGHITKYHRKGTTTTTKSVCLCLYPATDAQREAERQASGYRRRRDEELWLLQPENVDNPLRCPVRLYEFYLSKCPEAAKSRNDVLYLQPELACVPDSPLWYAQRPLQPALLATMLARITSVRQVHCSTASSASTASASTASSASSPPATVTDAAAADGGGAERQRQEQEEEEQEEDPSLTLDRDLASPPVASPSPVAPPVAAAAAALPASPPALASPPAAPPAAAAAAPPVASAAAGGGAAASAAPASPASPPAAAAAATSVGGCGEESWLLHGGVGGATGGGDGGGGATGGGGRTPSQPQPRTVTPPPPPPLHGTEGPPTERRRRKCVKSPVVEVDEDEELMEELMEEAEVEAVARTGGRRRRKRRMVAFVVKALASRASGKDAKQNFSWHRRT
uniref:Zinc finger MYM-type protein 3-like n=1 Tax=Petromyzon marinus TaxID=7757 RepID=A0AAJ7UHG2_PETMA|nr:zinc finger MYM-type protein 3-like [Petromyzon marinus]